MPTISKHTSFVVGGRDRAYAAIADEVRRELETEYATRMEKASPARRAMLRLEMGREIRRRVRKILSPTALF
jgi:hypothetical protein